MTFHATFCAHDPTSASHTGTEQVRFFQPSQVPRNSVAELEFIGGRDLTDAWSELQVDVEFVNPNGTARLVPAFWAGGRSWRVRYSSSIEGEHKFRSIIRGAHDSKLVDICGVLHVAGYDGGNPLLIHGGPRISDDQQHFSHTDGKPFFWLGDTWWSAMTARFRWPDVFQRIADDRAAKGFTVVQVVAGLIPEFVPWSPAMASEGGQPWEQLGGGKINPMYYSVPDLKIDYLVSKGIVPCIVGGWGNFAGLLGRDRIMQHWRYLVARYSAYPVVWCIAGEVEAVGVWEALARYSELEKPTVIATDPTDTKSDNVRINSAQLGVHDRRKQTELAKQLEKEQVKIWEDASNLVKEIDPFDRPRTVHAVNLASKVFSSRESFDFDMQQAGHLGAGSVSSKTDLKSAIKNGDRPVVVGECSYEGIFDSNWQDTQRFMFWSSVLSGTAGHTYGTMAISCFNSKDDPLPPLSRVSTHYWEDAIDWLGATHVAIGKRILERFAWWELSPSPDSLDVHASPNNWYLPYAATLSDGTMIIYQPSLPYLQFGVDPNQDLLIEGPGSSLLVKKLRDDTDYRATFIDPRTGNENSSFTFSPTKGCYKIKSSLLWAGPTGEDWVIVCRPSG